jgi:hypothetical protein
MDKDVEVCRLLLNKLCNRIILAEQAAEEARQICHEVQEILFDIEDNKIDFTTMQLLAKVGG